MACLKASSLLMLPLPLESPLLARGAETPRPEDGGPPRGVSVLGYVEKLDPCPRSQSFMRKRVAFGRERPHEEDPILEPKESARKGDQEGGRNASSPGARWVLGTKASPWHLVDCATWGKHLQLFGS